MHYIPYKANIIPVTTITRITAKAMLPPSYHPSLIPCNKIIVKQNENKNLNIHKNILLILDYQENDQTSRA